MRCNQNTQPYALVKCSKGIQDEGAEGIEGGRSVEIERNNQAHIKSVSFFFPLPSLFLCLFLSLTITAALEAELLNCSKMSELQSSLEWGNVGPRAARESGTAGPVVGPRVPSVCSR